MLGSCPAAKLPLKHLLSQSSPQIPCIAAWDLLTGLHTFRKTANGLQPEAGPFLGLKL